MTSKESSPRFPKIIGLKAVLFGKYKNPWRIENSTGRVIPKPLLIQFWIKYDCYLLFFTKQVSRKLERQGFT